MPTLAPSLSPRLCFSFLFHLSVLAFLCLLLPAESQLRDQEQQVLLGLNQFWQYPPLLSHWNSSNPTPHCSWPEIKCQGDSIAELDVSNVGINYTIPPIICDLKNLTLLNVSYNNIPGGFPTVLYSCSKLQTLDLSQNYFEGPIPSDIDRMANSLQCLILAATSFSFDIPASIGRLQSLRILHLYQAEFNGSYPVEIGNLANLEELRLEYNDKLKPSTLPLNFTRLKKLRHLSMAQTNLFGEIPDQIGDLQSLEYLDLGMNPMIIGGIPASIFTLTNLSHVYLFMTNLSREIPQVVSATNLNVIDLSANNLTGPIPQDFGKLEKLSCLILEFNQLTGGIPEGIGRLPALWDVRLSNNYLSGRIPPDMGQFSPLSRFEVAYNNLNGTLPQYLCAKNVLYGLAVTDNNFSGNLPETLGNCSSINTVLLNSNSFSGSVPAGLWTSPKLEILNMSSNMLTGRLPNELSQNLSLLAIRNNRFYGEIPRGFSSGRNLVAFDAINNLLNGTIPVELTALLLLSTLSLDRNQLSGSLPTSIDSWKSLSYLSLSHNQLSGPVPTEICFLPVLTHLDLSLNQLSGFIPPEIGRLKLNFLNLSSNHLTGRIPTAFDNGAYTTSFLNNAGLCASNSFMNLNICNSQSRVKSSAANVALIVTLIVAASLSALLLVLFLISFHRKRRHGFNQTWKLTPFQLLNFTESDVLLSLTDQNMIGSGGSGKVYRVVLNQSGDAVAVKRIWNDQKLDEKLEKEFIAEVEILGNVRHLNIVKLLCCISCENSKLLVYEYMKNRSLDHWIHKKKRISPITGASDAIVLDWPKRLRIAVGAAKGLCYMHHDCLPPIIHRDVKSSNILLDSDFNPKVADFGLARLLIKNGEAEAATMSAVAGSFGYLAPEYAYTTRVNEKIDVYSFGVVLLELATGREANDGDEDMCLAEWAWRHIQDGKPMVNALDEEIIGTLNTDEMCHVFKLGILCTATLPSSRPTMKEVLQILLRCSQPAIGTTKKPGNMYGIAPILKEPRREEMLQDDYHILQCNTL